MKHILKVSAGVRYYEDGIVNGTRDIVYELQNDGVKPRIPCVVLDDSSNEYRWNIEINAETGVIINWEKGTTAQVHYKVCDECEIEYFEDENLLCNNEGYWSVPRFLCPEEEGYGDYIIMKIDSDGKINKWNINEVNNWLRKQQDED